MTPIAIRWTNVLFAVVLTVVVAIAPMVFVVLSGQTAEAGPQQAVADGKAAVLASGVFDLPDQQVLLVLIIGAAVAALVAAIVVGARAERSQW